MVTAQEFLAEFCKEILRVDPMDRHIVVDGYARHMEARETVLRYKTINVGF